MHIKQLLKGTTALVICLGAFQSWAMEAPSTSPIPSAATNPQQQLEFLLDQASSMVRRGQLPENVFQHPALQGNNVEAKIDFLRRIISADQIPEAHQYAAAMRSPSTTGGGGGGGMLAAAMRSGSDARVRFGLSRQGVVPLVTQQQPFYSQPLAQSVGNESLPPSPRRDVEYAFDEEPLSDISFDAEEELSREGLRLGDVGGMDTDDEDTPPVVKGKNISGKALIKLRALQRLSDKKSEAFVKLFKREISPAILTGEMQHVDFSWWHKHVKPVLVQVPNPSDELALLKIIFDTFKYIDPANEGDQGRIQGLVRRIDWISGEERLLNIAKEVMTVGNNPHSPVYQQLLETNGLWTPLSPEMRAKLNPPSGKAQKKLAAAAKKEAKAHMERARAAESRMLSEESLEEQEETTRPPSTKEMKKARKAYRQDAKARAAQAGEGQDSDVEEDSPIRLRMPSEESLEEQQQTRKPMTRKELKKARKAHIKGAKSRAAQAGADDDYDGEEPEEY